MSKIRIYGDTSGYIDVAAPAAADNSTLDLSTVITDIPSQQVVQVRKFDTQSIAGWGMVDITGLSASITPTSTNSRIAVYFSVWAVSDYYKSYVRLLRGSTPLMEDATNPGSRDHFASALATDQSPTNSHGLMHHHSMQYIDSPATTSEITYKLQGSGRLTSNVMYVNRSVPDRAVTEYDSRFTSHLILMEIE